MIDLDNYSVTLESLLTKVSAERPYVPSYDLGCEHSQQYYIALQCMVEDADAESEQSVEVPEMEEVAS